MGIINKWIGIPELASVHGELVDQMLEVVHWFMAVLMIGWTLFFLYTLVRYHRKVNKKADYHGLRGHATTHVEIGVIIVEVVLLLGFAFPLWRKRVDDFPTGPDVVRIRAVGEQFSWTFHYPGDDDVYGEVDPDLIAADNKLGRDREDPNGTDDIEIPNEMIIPVNRPIVVEVGSKDVIHNLALTPMRIAQDAIPGTDAFMWFTPTKTGSWEIICGQLCGSAHFRMFGTLKVVSADEWETFLKENAPAPAAASISDPASEIAANP